MAAIDLSQIVNLINQLIPLVIVFAILPMIFKMLERAFGS